MDPDLIKDVSDSKTVSYSMIEKRLRKNGLTLSIKESRSYYATHLRNKGILSETVDLLQGRIGKSVFVRHYLKDNPTELRDRTLTALSELEQTLD